MKPEIYSILPGLVTYIIIYYRCPWWLASTIHYRQYYRPPSKRDRPIPLFLIVSLTSVHLLIHG